jgi:glycosyltransferase involved in cell wall biosynthesis
MTLVVVSAVNFSEGGPLTVLRECLASGRSALGPGDRLIALVHDRRLIDIDGVETVEFRNAKSSYLRRLKLEYFGFKSLSRQWRPDLWLSLHDVSPRLNGERQVVYCHNPAPFFRPRWRDIRFEPTLLLFSLFYSWIYRFNLSANYRVIVQQQWLRTAFEQQYGARNVMVAHPQLQTGGTPRSLPADGPLVLFYPTLPRAFKNIETICEAVILSADDVGRPIELRVTIDGKENRYARSIVDRYGTETAIRFIGRQDRAGMARNYAEAAALLFPSRLETWGLPISEAKAAGLPLLVADLPYAREAVGTYAHAAFAPATDSNAWAEQITRLRAGKDIFAPVDNCAPALPFAPDWPSLWRELLA